MRISFNWLKKYLSIDKTPEELAEILTSLGLEVEAIEAEEDIKGSLKSVVVAEVVECIKHPNADRLSLTKVNPGTNELLQVVCGAPNVAAGQKVLLACEGAVLHPANGESFVIKKGKIRGEVSEGMICAEDELGLSDNHEGIMVLPSDTPVGMTAAEYLNLSTDNIFEIGLTPNRADATSHIGVAQDVLAWIKVHENKTAQLIWPEMLDLGSSTRKLHVDIQIEDSELCPRYSGICLSGINIEDSPEWLKKRIRSMGLNPVNNVVDVSNFVMYEMGQPLHAFDYDRIADSGIRVKRLSDKTPFKGLDGADFNLSSNDLMICDGTNRPMCIAGVFGGLDSGVTEQTNRIFLESAHFNASSVRMTSMKHNLRTQSARCFEKGSDPSATVSALQRAAYLLKEICGAKVDSELYDVYPKIIAKAEIEFSVEKAIQLSGLDINAEQLKEVLFALDMEVQDLRNGNFKVFVPTNKPDVTRMADVVEEVSRVYGFDKIKSPETLRISFPGQSQKQYEMRQKLAVWLAGQGLCEIMNLSLQRSATCLKSGLWKEEDLVFIHNTSNVQFDVMRPGLCFSGLESIAFNVNRQQHNLAFFEMGKNYLRRGDHIEEAYKLGIWLYGKPSEEHWLEKVTRDQDFFNLKSLVDSVFANQECNTAVMEKMEEDGLFSFGAQWKIGPEYICKAGLIKNSVLSLFDLKKEVWYAEFDLSLLEKQSRKQHREYEEVSRFPQIKRDLALVLNVTEEFSKIEKIARQKAGKWMKDFQLFDIYENASQLGDGMKSYAVSFTFEDAERQLSGEEIEKLMQQLVATFEKELGARLR